MKLDVPTLVFILSLTCIAEVAAISIQCYVNRIYKGLGWWLLGSIAMTLGFIFLSLGSHRSLGIIAILGNPLLILGRICLFIGTLRFIEKKEKPWTIITLFLIFACTYYYYLLLNDNISARTIIVSTFIAIFSLLTSKALFNNENKRFSVSANFTAFVFLAHTCYLIALIIFTVFSKPMRSFTDFSFIQIAAFIVPTITSILWTFGFILMVNQRLSAENLEEKENLQRVFNTGPDGAFITRMGDGAFVDANLGFSAMSGYPRAEILEATPGINLWQSDADRQHFLAELNEKGVCENLEFAFRRKDGVPFIGMISAKTLTINGLPHIISVVRDITERRKHETEKLDLEARNRQLQKAESLGRMAGAIAHHFNNQLQSVMSNLELMSEPAQSLDPAKCLARAKQATNRAAEVSHLMLVYLGQTSSDLEPCFLAELCRAEVPNLQAALPRAVRLETECPSPGPVIHADALQIKQVLTNLITNAWEALDDTGGTIRLRLRTGAASDIPTGHRFPINWEPLASEYACLEVHDSGCGIAEGDIEKLFDPFFSTKFTGRGLGLPVVLGIVQAHGGGVSVESRPGQGSIFRVHLPVCGEAAAHLPMAPSPAPALPGSGTLLLVDDDECLLESTGAMIERMGYKLLTARDGIEAVAVFREHRDEIRCVITDLTMPRMDGWETLAALRQFRPDLPVILASGYDKGQVMSGSHPEQPQAFLGKPFGLRQLREAVALALCATGAGEA
jgi:PAS domain S-box-containing protein